MMAKTYPSKAVAKDRQPLPWAMSEARDLVALIAMALVGTAIAVYLTSVHYANVPLVCTAGGPVDCGAVTRSAYSLVPGTSLPITLPGMLWFIVSGGIAVYALMLRWQHKAESVRLWLGLVAWGALGMVFVIYLVYAEIVVLHKICEWCTVIHVLTLLTFLLAVWRLQRVTEAA